MDSGADGTSGPVGRRDRAAGVLAGHVQPRIGLTSAGAQERTYLGQLVQRRRPRLSWTCGRASKLRSAPVRKIPRNTRSSISFHSLFTCACVFKDLKARRKDGL